jgi:IS30 family transposase
MSHRLVTLTLRQAYGVVTDMSKDIDNIQRAVIKALHKDGHAVTWIAESLDVSRTTVHNVINNKGGKRQQQRADRYEAFFKDSNSGCYHNGELLPSADQLRSGDPLSELLLEEEITNRLIEGARHGTTC